MKAHPEVRAYLLASLVGTVAALAITIAIYGTFFQNFLENYNELSSHVLDQIERDQSNLVALLLANLAHGFLIATVIRWGKFYTPWRGAAAGATVAFLTDAYFCLTQYAAFKTMSLQSAIFDTLMWTLINTIVGALVAWVYRRQMATGIPAS